MIKLKAGSQCLAALLIICVLHISTSEGKPIDLASAEGYKDTEEIFNEWNNDDNYYSDESSPVQESSDSVRITHLPPVFIERVVIPLPVTTTTTTTTTPPPSSVYFPKTDIELGPLFERVGQARRNEVEGPVDLPVPYIIWKKDSDEGNANYWKKFYNTMYKVD